MSGLLIESREHCAGVRTLRPNDEQEIIVFREGAFLRNLPYLQAVGSRFAQETTKWSPEYADFLMEKGLGVDGLTGGRPLTDSLTNRILYNQMTARLIPFVFLFRQVGAKEGEYTGFSAHRVFDLPDDSSVQYNVFRGVVAAARGRHTARFAAELSLSYTPDVLAYVHRTRNPLAAYTNTQIKEFDLPSSAPWVIRYQDNPRAFYVAQETAKIVEGPDAVLDEFGVSRNAYREPNRGLEELREGHPSREIQAIMDGEFRMGSLDAVYCTYFLGQNPF